MGFFSIDGPLYKFIDKFWNLIKLNFMWLLFSLPVVTIGASTTTAFYVALRMADEEEGYVAHMFVKNFKKNLKQGIPLGLLNLFAAYAIYLDFALYIASGKKALVCLAMGMIGAFVVYFMFLYAYALSARYESSFFTILKNSSKISSRYFGRTILLTLIIALEIAIFIWNGYLMVIGALIAPACIIYTISGMSLHMFREIERNMESGEEQTEKK
jgi:uncharacterized membrane protein YesL